MLIEDNLEFLKPVDSDDLLPNVGRWVTLGGVLLVGSCGVSVVLSALIKYPVTVKASAVVRPEGELRIVEAGMQGTVNEILVKENQSVAKGEAIAKIDDVSLLTRRNQILLNIREKESEIKQIDAAIAATQVQINAESMVIERAIAQTEAELSRSMREYSDRKLIAEAEVREAGAALELAAEEASRYRELEGMGAISKLQIKEKLQAYKVALARQERAKVGLRPSAAGVEIARERITQQKARGKSTIAALNKERQGLITRRVQNQNQTRRYQQELRQIMIDIQKSIIRAPEAGIILRLELRNPSQVVRPGQAIAQIAPEGAPLLVKARIAAEDISKVKVCKLDKIAECSEGRVQMRISAYPYPDYGILEGAVRAVTADAIALGQSQSQLSRGIVTRNNGNNSVTFYEVTIQPEKLQLDKNGVQYPIKAGMEVSADIIAKHETLLAFILRKARLLTDM
ncbi:MAG: HlyD family secretion protein [Scytonematopsis contorta HA4267-MV1]|jgi:multidrug efflux pump subunit AcrA (membrane-fusion protein)|nr:HlyD family secretion protein [Scytonematopsis contorta HA4267-MV1]